MVIWGKHDLSFEFREPEAYGWDVAKAEIHVFDAGHFALNTARDEIAVLVQNFAGDAAPALVEIHVRDAFLAALMLTGTIEAAEQALSEAIATSGRGVAVDELLVATAKCAIQLRDECLPRAEIPFSLPPELQRLFLLSPVGRKCFVLRILMGLNLEMSSGILNLHRDEVDEALCRALSDLPRLAGVQSALARNMEHPVERWQRDPPEF